jgi:hypothetical protein
MLINVKFRMATFKKVKCDRVKPNKVDEGMGKVPEDCDWSRKKWMKLPESIEWECR